MSSTGGHPHLRLVGLADASDDAAERARDDVVAENRRAAGNTQLHPKDPRWVLAVRAYSQLQGSSLTPDRRAWLVRSAQAMGLRPFEANLIIAIVQDHARRGRGLDDAAGTVALLEPPAKQRDESVLLRWVTAILTALAANLFLIWWLTA